MIQKPFSLTAQFLAKQLNSDLDKGLQEADAQKHLEDYGENQIPQQRPKKRWRILVEQLLDPIIYILTAAALLSFVFSDWLEGVAIVIVILISVTIGFFMELRAIRSLEALRKMGQAMTRVIRSGKTLRLKASELVPGDLVLLESGDVVSADARLVEVDNLSVKESALTGESVPIFKKTATLPDFTLMTEQNNMVFKGTLVTTGTCKAIIVATGENTQLGKIQQMGLDAHNESTPLEKKLNQLSKWLIWLTLFFAVLIVIAGYVRGRDLLLMIETGVALAVAAIPEGLPIVATIALAQGMLRLSRKQVIIKKMEAVETLGATNIICTDKTGTLTEDKMKVHTLVFEEASITNVYHEDRGFLGSMQKRKAFDKIMMAGILCNNVKLIGEDGHGDSIELALMDFARHAGYDPISVQKSNPEKLELPFDAQRKLMATAHQQKEGFHVYVKGAFESLVVNCDTILKDGEIKSFDTKKKWFKQVDELASQGLRTLAFAYKETKKSPIRKTISQRLTFIGVMGFLDPARSDVRATIDIYKKAGIKVVMITGDHPGTSKKIAQEVGLLALDAPPEKVLQGKDLVKIKNADEGAIKQLLNASVFARVTPEQKLDLITFYQANNHIVGMIGDGINDVPALKKADIGIAMGVRGTEAAREAADVVLKNDKFTAIELAIRQGRVVFQNIRQFVLYLLSCNLAEIISVGFAALLNLPSPLLPLQILFLNLVTDVFPALALGLGKGEKDIMEQPPRDPKEPIMTRKLWFSTSIYGLCLTAGVLGITVYASFGLQLGSDTINNMAFYTLVFAQLFNVFNMPMRNAPFFKNEVTSNPWVWGAILLSLLITLAAYLVPPIAEVLSLQTLSFDQFGLTVLFALGSLVLAQLLKRWGVTT